MPNLLGVGLRVLGGRVYAHPASVSFLVWTQNDGPTVTLLTDVDTPSLALSVGNGLLDVLVRVTRPTQSMTSVFTFVNTASATSGWSEFFLAACGEKGRSEVDEARSAVRWRGPEADDCVFSIR